MRILLEVLSGLLGRSLLAMTLAVLALAGAGVASGEARADDLPFWERADAAKARKAGGRTKSYAKASYSKSKRSYASTKKLGGWAEVGEPPRRSKHKVRVASLDGGSFGGGGSLSGGGNIRWTANSGCLDAGLRSVLNAASAYGSITVNSTCRSHSHNRAVGGAKHSKHLTGDAVDFRVHGNAGAVYAYLKSSGAVGGLKHYGGGLFHIDNGDRRSW